MNLQNFYSIILFLTYGVSLLTQLDAHETVDVDSKTNDADYDNDQTILPPINESIAIKSVSELAAAGGGGKKKNTYIDTNDEKETSIDNDVELSDSNSNNNNNNNQNNKLIVNVAKTSQVLLKPAPIFDSIKCNKSYAILTWHHPTEYKPTYYEIYKWDHTNDKKEWTLMHYSPNVTDKYLVVKELMPHSPYSFRVRAMWQNGTISNFSDEGACVTERSIPVKHPDFISAYRMNDEKEPSIMVRWHPLAQNEKGAEGTYYNITLWKVNTNTDVVNGPVSYKLNNPYQSLIKPNISLIDFSIESNENASEYMLTNANIDTKLVYLIGVEARNTIGSSMGNFSLYPVQFNESMPEFAPQNFRVKVIDGNSAQLNWNPVPIKSIHGNFKGFNITVTDLEQPGTKLTEIIKENVTTYTLKKLLPSSSFNVSIRVLNGQYESEPAILVNVATPNYITPEKPVFVMERKCETRQKDNEYSIQLILQKLKLKSKVDKFNFELCIKDEWNKTPIDVYCQDENKRQLLSKETYDASHASNNQMFHNVDETDLNSTYQIRAIVYAGESNATSDPRTIVMTKQTWKSICENALLNKPTTTTTTTTTTLAPHTRLIGKSDTHQTLNNAANNQAYNNDQTPEIEPMSGVEDNGKLGYATNDGANQKSSNWIVPLVSAGVILLMIVSVVILVLKNWDNIKRRVGNDNNTSGGHNGVQITYTKSGNVSNVSSVSEAKPEAKSLLDNTTVNIDDRPVYNDPVNDKPHQ